MADNQPPPPPPENGALVPPNTPQQHTQPSHAQMMAQRNLSSFIVERLCPTHNNNTSIWPRTYSFTSSSVRSILEPGALCVGCFNDHTSITVFLVLGVRPSPSAAASANADSAPDLCFVLGINAQNTPVSLFSFPLHAVTAHRPRVPATQSSIQKNARGFVQQVVRHPDTSTPITHTRNQPTHPQYHQKTMKLILQFLRAALLLLFLPSYGLSLRLDDYPFSLGVKDSLMIAHSFHGHPSFGPAGGLHGATYTCDVEFLAQELHPELNWVIDIGVALDILSSVLSKYNLKNLDEVFPGKIMTTTEFMCKQIHNDIVEKLKERSSDFQGIVKVKLWESHKAWATYIGGLRAETDGLPASFEL